MNINYENTRAIGIGETLLPTDFWCVPGDKDLSYVEPQEVGKIVSDEEMIEYRRSLQADPYEAMYAALALKTDAARTALKIACENIQLLDSKQLDYGPNNISSFGEFGILVRMNDKIERLKHLQKMIDPKNESIEDTYKDIGNYALIALMVRRNLWH